MDRGSGQPAARRPLNTKPDQADILGVEVSVVDMEATLRIIARWVQEGRREYICFANAYGVVENRRNHSLAEAYHRAGMVVADGVPVVWAAHAFGYWRIGRVYGPDLLLAACARSLETGWSHYFYGGAPGVTEKLVSILQARFSGLRIAGWMSPPFRKSTPFELDAAIRAMNSSQADILWVGLGAPRQEIWMAENRSRLTVPVAAGVGAAFDFISGAKPEAPRWMQEFGLGWFFRLLTEPRRLWRRYIFGNAQYGCLLIRQILIRRFHRHSDKMP
jgi:N-acetylglucosaminyldiphosphoundecaprenol N-acetyl-beta-D-mannosaminyltransferase